MDKKSILFLVITLLIVSPIIGCSSAKQYFEIENTVIMSSFYNEKVREAFLNDVHTEINASYLNLKTGETSKTTKPDIIYRLSCGTICFPIIGGINNVELVDYGKNRPTKEACQEFIKVRRIGRGSVTVQSGRYTCIQTNLKNVGWIRFDRFSYSGIRQMEIQLTYYLWK